MQRVGYLWESLTSFENLLRAATKARRGKSGLASAAHFHFHLERELVQLQDALRSQTWRPGPFHEFEIYQPKRRIISAAPFRDRVVHHALCSVLEPIFEPTFIGDSYACRRGKGTHAALDRFQHFMQRYPFVLKCDVRKFFPSVDHQILKATVRRKIKDPHVLWLVDAIIDHSPERDGPTQWSAGDDLFTSLERRRGLPIGNQTSQFLANVFLNPFDHFVKETLRCRAYVRYCDDFVLGADDKGWLREALLRCRELLQSLRLQPHPDKSVIARSVDGIRFLGFRVFPDHRLLVSENALRMRRRLKTLSDQFADGEVAAAKVTERIRSWIAHAEHADTFRLRERVLGSVAFVRSPVAESPTESVGD